MKVLAKATLIILVVVVFAKPPTPPGKATGDTIYDDFLFDPSLSEFSPEYDTVYESFNPFTPGGFKNTKPKHFGKTSKKPKKQDKEKGPEVGNVDKGPEIGKGPEAGDKDSEIVDKGPEVVDKAPEVENVDKGPDVDKGPGKKTYTKHVHSHKSEGEGGGGGGDSGSDSWGHDLIDGADWEESHSLHLHKHIHKEVNKTWGQGHWNEWQNWQQWTQQPQPTWPPHQTWPPWPNHTWPAWQGGNKTHPTGPPFDWNNWNWTQQPQPKIPISLKIE